MQYGNFTDEGRAFVIHTPYTPTPWTNKLFNDEFHIDVTQRLEGGGVLMSPDFSNAPFNRPQNRFYLNVDGRCYALCRGQSDSYLCEHRLYQTQVTEVFGDLTVTLRIFVPVSGQREYWTATLYNAGEAKNVSLFAAFAFQNPGYMAYSSQYSEQGHYIYYTGFPYYVQYEDKEKVAGRQNYRYILSSVRPDTYEGNEQRFFGCDDDSVMPIAVQNNRCENGCGEIESCIGAMQHKIKLENGVEKTVHYVVGLEKTKQEVENLAKHFPNVEQQLTAVKELWEQRCSCFMIETPDTELNYLTNYWLKRQLTFFARLNRGGFYCPVRNQLQDYLGYALIDPKDALNRALKIVERQHHNGYLKQYYNTNGRPDEKLCLLHHSDSYIWFIICLIEVIEKNGDPALYNKKVRYFDSPVEEPLLVHLKKAAYYMSTQIGEHGLCLMLDGDWNDPVNGPGRLGKGESTWNSMALCYAIDRLNKISYDKTLAEFRQTLLENINRYCWDGEWYLAGINDDGIPYGSKNDAEAQKFLNAQTWSVICGAATGDRLKKVLKTIESMGTPFGYLLIDPPFTKYSPIWGRVSLKTHGTTENGSVYCHSVMFKAFADCLCKNGDAARDTILRILPTNKQHAPEQSLQIPIYYSNYYIGYKNENFGRSSFHYRTGTVAWHFWVIIEHIFGLKLSAKKVEADPCLPQAWSNAKLTFCRNGKRYELTVQNQKCSLVCKG